MSGFFSFLFGGAETRAEKRRLESFFSALPLEYCGWGPSGAMLFSRGFTKMLGIDRLNTIHDIENALKPSDAAALEGCFLALTRGAEPFSITVHTMANDRILKLSGSRGRDLGAQDSYDILWLQDITPLALETDDLKGDLKTAEETASRLRDTLDAFPMPVWVSDALSDIAWVNTAYARTAGKNKAEILDKKIWLPVTLVGSNDGAANKLKELAQTARTEKKQQSIRARLIVGGQRRMVEFVFLPIENSDMVVVQASDVTREEELAAEHKRYVAAQGKLLEQLHTAVAIFGADHRLEFHNSAFSRLWNIEDAYLNEHPKLGDFMEKLREMRRLPEQADFRAFKKSWLDMFTGLLNPHEDMMYLPNGTAIRWLAAPHPMGGLMMTFEDVTSRLALETSYNTLMAMQRETLDNLAEGVSVYGADGRLKFYNPRFMALWGLHPEDLEGEPHVTE
ncbi:MAG: PAS domain-containing protein, partial [Alphaproteobacteria bacterium]|nr:PAS domain-containing protein [Alphaproteobacteria bacterium]